GVGAAFVILGHTEIGKHVLVAPACVAELAPVVEVFGLTADVDQSIDGARSAESLAARRYDIAAVAFRLRFGLVAPVVSLVGEELAVAERDMQPGILVGRACFEQQHAVAPRLGQSVRENATSAAGSYNNVVVGLHILRHSITSSARSRTASDIVNPSAFAV